MMVAWTRPGDSEGGRTKRYQDGEPQDVTDVQMQRVKDEADVKGDCRVRA